MTRPIIKQYYQNKTVARGYDRARFSGAVGRTFDRIEKRALASVVRAVTRDIPNPIVLDIPCGTGRITELLLSQGLTVIGGDISHEMIEVAKEKCARFESHVSWQQLDLDELALETNSIDIATCIRLFHHLDTMARARILGELARVTRRYVVVNVSFSSPIYRLRRRVKRILRQGVSTTSSTWAEIQRECAEAGLRISSRRFVMPLVSEDVILVLEKVEKG